MKTKNEIINEIINYFKENESVFNECIEELDSWNGFLGDRRCYNMEELDEIYSNNKPIDILYRAFYGHDDENYTINERGEKIYGEFNPNRNYFYFNGYGNLVSCDYVDYTDYMDDYTVEELSEHRNEIYTIEENEELNELFNELEETEEE